jgi:2-C-methyl-D-erythritol 4-phosphate cytidylyltransferase
MTSTNPKPPQAAVVVVAAGRSHRLGGRLPKQFQMLGFHPVFAHSLRLFDSLSFVNEIALVLPNDGLPYSLQTELEQLNHTVRYVEGGLRRQDSVAEGLAALQGPYDVALIHDAARPFPDPVAIQQLVVEAIRHGGGLLATQAIDTVKRSDGNGTVAETLDREQIWLAQTPQAIRADLVPQAIEDLRQPDQDFTDEASLLEHWGLKVALVESDRKNFKITHPLDLVLAESILGSEPNPTEND